MRILLVADTLLTGGAELFLLRQYCYLKANKFSVYLFVTRPDKVDKRILQKFPTVCYISPSLTLIQLAALGDRLFQKIFKKSFFLDNLNKSKINSTLKKLKPDVIHSHLLQADYKVFLANRKKPVRHIITVHGDYVEHIKKNEPTFFNRIIKVLSAVDRIVLISTEQQTILNHFLPSINNKLIKIYNGYSLDKMPQKTVHEGFSFGMIARALPEKGWEAAILAFLKLNHPESRLLLYGEGIYMDQLRRKYTDARILFKGFTNEPLHAIQEIDAGLFPSYYQSESLPTTITEYLMMHKPVITTNVGECAEMIRHENEYAGIVLELKNARPDVDELAAAMQRMLSDTGFYVQCSRVASEAKKKFGMENCMNKYLNVYHKK